MYFETSIDSTANFFEVKKYDLVLLWKINHIGEIILFKNFY